MRRNVDASKKKFFVATEIIVFDFELFIGVPSQFYRKKGTDSILNCQPLLVCGQKSAFSPLQLKEYARCCVLLVTIAREEHF
jgi:hypothetical protein